MDDHDAADRGDARSPEATAEAEMDAPMPTDQGAARARADFDPTPYLRQLRGRGGGSDYLDVKWRLLWLRTEHPDAEIVTEHVQLESTIAIFKATVTLPAGGKATGYGSETAGDFGDFIEKAETKAIGRALNALGYGTQFAEAGDDAEAARPAPPRNGPPSPGRPGRPSPETVVPTPVERPAAPPPIDLTARERPARAAPEVARSVRPAAARRETDPDLAEYSWSAFWPWAKGLGLSDRKAVEAAIGQPIVGLSPAKVRDLVVAARGEA